MLRSLIIICFVIIAVVYFASNSTTYMSRPDQAASIRPETQIVAPPPVRPGDQFRILKTVWRAGGFGAVGIFDFVLENGNAFTAKDPMITCRFYAESGTHLGTATQTVFQSFPPRSKRSISEFNMGLVHSQAKSVRCEVVSASM